jgi:hypothetical protein
MLVRKRDVCVEGWAFDGDKNRSGEIFVKQVYYVVPKADFSCFK